MSATDPSRKWSFRRSLPQLGTACNLHFFACIHTSAFTKETLRKLDWIRSQLYEQLRKRPKQHFAQNLMLYINGTTNAASGCKKQRKLRRQEMRAPRRAKQQKKIYTLYPLVSKEKLLLLLLLLLQCQRERHAAILNFNHALTSLRRRHPQNLKLIRADFAPI